MDGVSPRPATLRGKFSLRARTQTDFFETDVHMKNSAWVFGLLTIAAWGMTASNADAFWRSRHYQYECCKPYNAFSQPCGGCCCPSFMPYLSPMAFMGGCGAPGCAVGQALPPAMPMPHQASMPAPHAWMMPMPYAVQAANYYPAPMPMAYPPMGYYPQANFYPMQYVPMGYSGYGFGR